MNINKLKGRIVEAGLTIEILAERINIDKSTFYRKLNAGGDTITIKEARTIVDELKLTAEEATAIFFSNVVA